MSIDLKKVKQVHFVGIGGVGVSAAARMMMAEGKIVTGSDLAPSPVTDALRALGVEIKFGHAAEHLGRADLVVYSPAVPENNPELAAARARGIPSLSYPEFLGEISKNRDTVAIAGTHGKTTTTAMVAQIFIEAGFEPTVIVGSNLLEQKSNFVAGRSQYFIVEACEYQRSFLNLRPWIAVITNIDADHLDYYRDLDDIKLAFAEFTTRAQTVITEKEYGQLPTGDFHLLIPGAHNVKNAQAALAVALAMGISAEAAIKALNRFRGTGRRFEFKGETKTGVAVYDDYAHHPTEIKATLAAARSEKLPTGGRLLVAFQPHLYSRTKQLLNEFAVALVLADETVVLPIYAAREAFDPTITHRHLAEAIGRAGGQAAAAPDEAAALVFLRQWSRRGDLIITMGAGDVYRLADLLLQ